MEKIKVDFFVKKTKDGFLLFIVSRGKQVIINLGFPENIVGDLLEEASQQSEILDVCSECKSYAYHHPDCSQSLLTKHNAAQQSVHPTAFRRGLILGWFVTAVIHIVAALLFDGG